MALRLAKLVLALLVTAGLIFAGQKSLQQWRAEHATIEAEVDSLRRSLVDAQSPAERTRIAEQIEHKRSVLPNARNMNWPLIGLAAVFYACGLVPNAFLLRRALLSFGQRPRRSTAIAAQLLGHVGKYVPGKAMVVVLRAAALRRDDVAMMPATISIFLETFLMMAVGAVVAAAVVVWLPVPGWIAIAAIGVAVLASLPTLPPVLRFAAAKVCHRDEMANDSRIDYRLFAAGWGWSLLTWLLIGASFTALILAIPTPAPTPAFWQLYAVATAAISLAVVIGFASLLPGGAGIRELVLTTILAVLLGSMHGLLAAIAARGLFLVVEAVLALACWWYLGRPDTNISPAAADPL